MDSTNRSTDPINIPLNPAHIMEYLTLQSKEDEISQIWSNYRYPLHQRNDSKFFGKSRSPYDTNELNYLEPQLSTSPPESTSSNCSFSLYQNGAFGGSQNTDTVSYSRTNSITSSLLAPNFQQLNLDQSPRSRTPESDFSDANYPTLSAFPQNYKIMGDILELRPSSPSDYQPLTPKMGTQDTHIDNTYGYIARTCGQHNMPLDYLCETCQFATCLKCLQAEHQNHHTVEMRETFQIERERGVNTVNTAKSELLLLGDSFKSALKKIENAELHVIALSKSTAASVIKEVHITKDALEKKEKDLLTTIHNLTTQRLDYLENRKKTVLIMEKALNIASFNLKNVLENGGNPLDLITLQRFAQSQIEYVRYLKDHFPDIAQYNIKLNGFENKFLEVLQNCGDIQEAKSQLVNSKSLFASNTPSGYHPERAVGYGRHSSHIRLGRPILLARHNMVTQCRPASPMPLPLMVIKYAEGSPLALTRPWGVACDPDGNMVVADRSNNRLLVFEVNGNFLRVIGEAGSGPLQFSRPAGMCFDARKRLIVADKDNHRVQVLTVEGKFLFEFGSRGGFEGQFSYPWDVASNAHCQIVVSDTRNRRIQMFSAEGHFIRLFDPADASRVCENVKYHFKVLDSPRGLCFTPDGKLLVTDFNYHHILSVDPDFRKCRVLKIFFDTKTTLQRPQGIIADDEGNIVLADSKNHRIIVLDPSMRIKWMFGSNGTRDSEMERPSGVALTPNGHIVFVDFGNDRLLVY